MNFKEHLNRNIVSFDFDGVMHTDVIPGTHHPINMQDYNPTPHLQMHEKVKQEAKNNKVVIVTKRDQQDLGPVHHLIQQYNLPINQVYGTNNEHKLPTLLKIGVIRHYDDDERLEEVLPDHGIEFIFVRP